MSRPLQEAARKLALSPATNEGGLMMDLFYLSIGVLFFVGCWALVRGIDRL